MEKQFYVMLGTVPGHTNVLLVSTCVALTCVKMATSGAHDYTSQPTLRLMPFIPTLGTNEELDCPLTTGCPVRS